MSQESLLSTMWRVAQERPAADFLVGSAQTMSYAGLIELVLRIITEFDRRALGVGDRVLIVTTNSAAAIGLFIASLLDGKVPVMLTPETPDQKAAAIAASVEPTLIVADAQRGHEGWAGGAWHVDTFPAQPAGLFRRRSRRDAETLSGLALPLTSRAPHLPDDDDDPAYVLFTSGTTSSPTGVTVSRGNLAAQLRTLTRLFGYTTRSRIFNDMVLAHGDGLVQGPLLGVFNGCAIIRSGGFAITKIEEWLNAVRLHSATHVVTVPTVWAMIDRYAAYDDYFDGEECVALLSVAARLEKSLWETIEARFKKPVFNQYGLTETVASACYAGPHPEMGPMGTIGCPVDCEARLAPFGSDPCPTDVGELQLKGPNIFAGYWRDPDRTAAAFTHDGWMHTGDTVRRRQDGSYEFLGRLKTAIMSAGFLIRPEEIDEVLGSHPAVAEVATVGLEDVDFEEIVVSAVVLNEAAEEKILTEHCRRLLEPLKVPKFIVAVAEIPRGVSGKPELPRLREMLLEAVRGASKIPTASLKVLETDVVTLAADVFRVAPATLALMSSPETVAAWDSFSQIKLILAAEARFGIRLPPAAVARIRSLGDLVEAVRSAQT